MILVQGSGTFYGNPQYISDQGSIGWTEDGGSVLIPTGAVTSVDRLRTKAKALVRSIGLRGDIGTCVSVDMRTIPEIGYTKVAEFVFDLTAPLPPTPVPIHSATVDTVSLEGPFIAFELPFPVGVIASVFREGDLNGIMIRYLTGRNPYGIRDVDTREVLRARLRALIPRFNSFKSLDRWIAKAGDTVMIKRRKSKAQGAENE